MKWFEYTQLMTVYMVGEIMLPAGVTENIFSG